VNPLRRKYRRFASLRRRQGWAAAASATISSLANSLRYRLTFLSVHLPGKQTPPAISNCDGYDPVAFLPVVRRAETAAPPSSVAVVIPAYRDLAATRECLESVLRTPSVSLARIIVVDDASPEPELSAYLDEHAARGTIHLVRNAINLGFVRSVNSGMQAAGELDVVLLNSDTIVAGDWLDRLAAHAHARVGTVTPFSNNATICSYPTLDGLGALPPDETVESWHTAFATANSGRAVEIPTAVGFCMYIRRACLDEVGPFDVEAFDRGYGEENDFCLRAAELGWKHVLAADAFVWHTGEVSFGASAAELQETALEELRRRHPDYLPAVARHVEQDPARPYRIAATAARFRLGRKPVILAVTHPLGGGTERHVLDLSRRFADDARFLILQPTQNGLLRLWSPEADDAIDLTLRPTPSSDLLIALLSSLGVSRLHVHHVLGLPGSVHDLVRRLGVPFDFTVHDYYAICPRVRLARPLEGFCGGPEPQRCRECFATPGHALASDIDRWQRDLSWLLTDAERVICPSQDAASHLAAYVAGPELVVALHDTIDHITFPPVAPPRLAPGEPMRIATLGVLSADKGARVVAECARLAHKAGGNAEFIVIGYVPGEDLHLIRGAGLSATGPYDPEHVQAAIAAARPHLMWFPAQWPETYSYTLSEAMMAGLPIVAPNLGAFSERVAGRRWTWCIPWDMTPRELAALFARIGHDLRQGQTDTQLRSGSAAATKDACRAMDDFYDNHYLVNSRGLVAALPPDGVGARSARV